MSDAKYGRRWWLQQAIAFVVVGLVVVGLTAAWMMLGEPRLKTSLTAILWGVVAVVWGLGSYVVGEVNTVTPTSWIIIVGTIIVLKIHSAGEKIRKALEELTKEIRERKGGDPQDWSDPPDAH